MTTEHIDKFRVSETFCSIQGEGQYTGQLTGWVRFFACNLQCPGFSQPDPTNPNTYHNPLEGIDIKSYKTLDDLPIIKYGCDSAYSVAAKFKHLCPDLTATEIVDQLLSKMPGHSMFSHRGNNPFHLAFTGGEPLIPKNQRGLLQVLEELLVRKQFATNLTIETNGTQKLSSAFKEFFAWRSYNLFFSVSPKLFTVSGEENDKAIRPDIVKEYQAYGQGQLKFVVANEKRCWTELENVIDQYQSFGVHFPIWIMPVGSTKEQQESQSVRAVAEEAMSRGYNVSARVHSLIFGNGMGK